MYEDSDDGGDWDADAWVEESTAPPKTRGGGGKSRNNGGGNVSPQQQRRAAEREAKERMNESNGNLIMIIAFSLVIIIDAIVRSGDEDIDAGAAVGFSIVSIIMSAMKYCHSVCVDEVKSPSFEVCFGFGLVVLWIIGVILLTFNSSGPFGNLATSGFFAVWVCLMTAGHYVMSVWGSLSDEDSSRGSWNFCGLMSFKKGVTPTLGVTLVLAIGLLASAISKTGADGGGRATITIVLMVPTLLALLLMICLPLKWYGNPDNFLVIMSLLIGINFLIVALTTLGDPFAPREVEDPENPGVPLGFALFGNGFFTAIGLFLALVVMMWNAHHMILIFNNDNGTAHGFPGRHLWLAVLFLSALIVLFASTGECSNFDGCDENDYIAPALGLALWTMVLCPVLFCLCRTNADNGDIVHMDPEWEIEYFANNYQRIEFIGAFLLQAGWIAAAGALTFSNLSPFNSSSAGFFFIWFGCFFSVLYFQAVCPSLGLLSLRCLSWEPPNGMKAKNTMGIALVLFSTIVQAVATGLICVVENECSEVEFVAFGLQAILLFSSMLLLFMTPDTLGICALLTSYLVMAITFAQLVVTTIVLGPFDEDQGNGFFAAWVATYGAYYNLRHYEWKFVDI